MVVLGCAGLSPVEEEHVEALADEHFGPGVAGMQVEDGRVADEPQEEHHRRPSANPVTSVPPQRGLAQ